LEVWAAGVVVVHGEEELSTAVDREVVVVLGHDTPAAEIHNDSWGDRSPLLWIVQDILDAAVAGDKRETLRGPFHRIHPFLDCRLPVCRVSTSFAGGGENVVVVVVAKIVDVVAVAGGAAGGAEGNYVVEGED
jgi:hypothetical protein